MVEVHLDVVILLVLVQLFTMNFSYDLRKKDQKDTHWIEKSVLGTRAYFRTMSEPAALVIDGVEVTDEADYRCRVDFSRSPTRNYKLKLVVTGQYYRCLK